MYRIMFKTKKSIEDVLKFFLLFLLIAAMFCINSVNIFATNYNSKEDILSFIDYDLITHSEKTLTAISSNNYGYTIGKQTFSNISPKYIIQNDDRSDLNPPDKRVVQLQVHYFDQAEGIYSFGSGSFIAKDIIVTSAHVVRDRNHRSPKDIFVNYYDGQTYKQIKVTRMALPSDWSSTGAQASDYAILKLETPISNDYYGLDFTNTSKSGLNVHIIGYPKNSSGNYPKRQKICYGITEYDPSNIGLLFYNLDMDHGDSGAPIIYNNRIIAINKAGLKSYGETTNYGVQVCQNMKTMANSYSATY